MAVDDLYVLTVHYCTPGGPVSFGVGYKQTSGTNDADTLDAFIASWRSTHEAALRLMLSGECEMDAFAMCPIAGVDEVPGYIATTGDIGGEVGDALPNNVAQVLGQLTDAPNANANGRIYIAGVTEDSLAGSVFDAAQVALAQTFADLLDNDVNGIGGGSADFSPVVISKVLNGAPRVPWVGFSVLGLLAHAQPRQQRRRGTKRLGVS